MAGLKVPPQNIEAEEVVLGAIMIDADAIIKVTDVLAPIDFYLPAHRLIFETQVALFERHQPIDIVNLTNRMKEDGTLDRVGGASYLSTLVEGVPSSSHIVHYAGLVKEKRVLRSIIETAAEATEAAFNPQKEVESILDDVEQKMFAISQGSIRQKFVAVKDELKNAYERIERLQSGDGALRGVGTGFRELDSCLGGLQKSDLVIVGARPSVGKTTFVMDIARHAAIKEGVVVGVFSLEMSRDQVIDRLIAAESNVALWRLRNGKIQDDTEFQMIQAGLDVLSRAPIFIDDTAGPTMLQIKSMARRLQMEHGLGLLVVDYLQLIQPRTNSDNMVQQITEISRALKGLARELNIPVVALSQLSREVDKREVKIPRLSDLRESGSIEQDADVVMFLYRKDRDKLNPSPEEQNTAEVIVAKHRNGALINTKVKFDPDRVSFRDIDHVHSNNNGF
ncbi:MAG: replicative DNA helicase [bacterium]|nr:replicative DNA helicase [bacterium]